MAFEVLRQFAELRNLMGTRQGKDPMEMENLALRNIKLRQDISGPTDMQKYQQKQYVDQSKYIFEQLRDLVSDPEVSPATRDVYIEMMKSHFFGLPEQLRAILLPLAQGTPLDPVQQKQIWFDRHFPKPDMPEYNPENPIPYAQAMFAMSDYQNKKERFMGVDPGTPTNVHPLPNMMYAIRDKLGNVNVMSAEDARLEEIAKGYNTTAAAILANGGRWPTGPWMEVKNGTTSYRIRPMRDIIHGVDNYQVFRDEEGKPIFSITETKRSQAVKDRPMPDSLSKFLMKLGANNSDDPTDSGRLAKKFRNGMDSGGREYINTFITNTLEPAYPGWNFKFDIKGEEKTRWKPLPGASYKIEGDDWRLIAYPATRNVELKDERGNSRILAVDDNTGIVYDGNGVRQGLLEDITAMLSDGSLTWSK